MSQVKGQKEQDRLNAKLHSISANEKDDSNLSAIKIAFEKAFKPNKKEKRRQVMTPG